MTFYDGLAFFILLLIALVPAVVLGLMGKRIKHYAMLLSLFWVYIIYREESIQLFYLIVYLFVEWHVIAIYQVCRRRFGQNKPIYHHALILGLLPLFIAKFSGFLGHSWFGFLGVSYITFKVIQIIIESYDGVIEKSSFYSTMSFLLFFPTISSGPIDRSRRYEADCNITLAREAYLELLGSGIWKILLGILYKFVLSAIAFQLMGQVEQSQQIGALIAYAYLYGFYLFFDFAGYSLMAIGTSYVLGIKTPDNFNKPFISRDIKDFWDRWHITLSHWFRDFLFSRFIMNAIRNKWFRNRMNAASAGFMINMLVMGLWHGPTIDYLIYGLYHGTLLALTERMQKKRWYKKVKDKPWYQAVSWFVTLNLVMFGFFIFSGRLTDLIGL